MYSLMHPGKKDSKHINVCPFSSKPRLHACLDTAKRAAIFRKTETFLGKQLAVRLNGASDI
jgi:hypothetical protein